MGDKNQRQSICASAGGASPRLIPLTFNRPPAPHPNTKKQLLGAKTMPPLSPPFPLLPACHCKRHRYVLRRSGVVFLNLQQWVTFFDFILHTNTQHKKKVLDSYEQNDIMPAPAAFETLPPLLLLSVATAALSPSRDPKARQGHNDIPRPPPLPPPNNPCFPSQVTSTMSENPRVTCPAGNLRVTC